MNNNLELATLDEIWENIGDYECNFYPDDPTDSFKMPQFPNLKEEPIHQFESYTTNKTFVPPTIGRSLVKREEPETLHSLNEPFDQPENILESTMKINIHPSNVNSEANVLSGNDSESRKAIYVKEETDIEIHKGSLPVESGNYCSATGSYLHMTASFRPEQAHLNIKRENSTAVATTTILANSWPTTVKDEAAENDEYHEDVRGILQPVDNIATVATLEATTECIAAQPGGIYHRLKTEGPDHRIPESAPEEEKMKMEDLQRNGSSHLNSDEHKQPEDGSDQREDKTEVWQVLNLKTEFDYREAASSLRPSRERKRKRARIIYDTDGSDDERHSDEGGNSGIQDEPTRGYPCESDEKTNVSRLRSFLLHHQDKGDFVDFPAEKLIEMVDCSARSVFKCKTCDKEWACTRSISRHVYAHAKGKCFPCVKCGRDFQGKKTYDVHQELHRLKIWREKDGLGFGTQHTCQVCNTTFPTKHALKRHGKSHQKEDMPYQCGCCEKVFKCSIGRLRHEMRHCVSDARKYACTLCDNTFCNIDTLRQHVKLHNVYNADTGSYECPECPEKFTSAKMFRLHTITHNTTSVICDKCGRQFLEKYHFDLHKRHCQQPKKRKDPEEKFSCDVCGKEFKKKQVLQRHKMIHSGSRPFACTHCEMTFQQSGTRDRHTALHFKNGQFRDVTKHVVNVKEGKDGRKYISN